jgi:hypothetical protein
MYTTVCRIPLLIRKYVKGTSVLFHVLLFLSIAFNIVILHT